MRHRIRSTTHAAGGEPLYWSGEFGWVTRGQADLYETSDLAQLRMADTELETVFLAEFSSPEFMTVLAALNSWRADGSAEIALELYQFHSKEGTPASSSSRFAAATGNWRHPPLLSDQVSALIHRMAADAQV